MNLVIVSLGSSKQVRNSFQIFAAFSSPILAQLPCPDPLGIPTKLSCVFVGWPALPNEIRLLAPLSLLNEAVAEFILVVRTSILVLRDCRRTSSINVNPSGQVVIGFLE